MTDDLLQRGIAALRAGDKAEARRLFGRIIRQNPRDEQAWLWMSGAVDAAQERLTCLNKALEINPNNQAAQRGLDALQKRLPTAPALPVETQPVPQPKPTLVQAVLGTEPSAAEQLPTPNPAESTAAAYPYVKVSDMLDHSKSLDELDSEKRKALEGFVPLIAQDLTVNHLKPDEIIERIASRGFSRKAVEQIVREIARQPTRAPIRYERKLTKEQFESLPSPWLTILIHPTETIRRIVYYAPEQDVFLLVALDGLVQFLTYVLYLFLLFVLLTNQMVQSPDSWESTLKSLPSTSFTMLAIAIGVCAVAGPIWNLLNLFLTSWLFSTVGRWLGGKAYPVEVRAVYAWSTIPRLWGAFLLVFKIVFVGYVIYANSVNSYIHNPTLFTTLTIFLLIDYVILMWSGFISTKGLSEVHMFSAWRAVGTAYLSRFIVFVATIAFACLILVILLTLISSLSGSPSY